MADVLIVGAGLAGLSCARALQRHGMSFQLIEATDDIGGRVRTDNCDGFLLDRGFQVLLTAYPEARQVFDYPSLQLGHFQPGALIRFEGKFHRFVDPWRQPQHLIGTLTSPVATFRDKLRVAQLRRQVCRMSLEQIASAPDSTTREALRAAGFSDRILQTFFQAFLGGVFLERELETSSRMMRFVMRMFATGDAALPARGMGTLARQLATELPEGAIWTNTRIEKVDNEHQLILADGRTLSAPGIVLATPAPVTAKLLNLNEVPAGRSVTCFYFAADQPPVKEPILLLNGDGTGPLQNVCVPSQVCASYAPPGRALISVSVVDTASESPELQQAVIAQLEDWFGGQVSNWQLLRTYAIRYALPIESPASRAVVAAGEKYRCVFICGDHTDSASIQGALVSGRRAAEQVAAHLRRGAENGA